MTAIQNNPVQNNQSSVLRAAATGAVVGGALKGAGEILGQKTMFKHADAFVKSIDEGALVAKQAFLGEKGFIGEAVDQGLQHINEAAQKAKDFVTGGKLDLGNVAKKAGKGALQIGLLCAGFAVLGNVLGKSANAKKAE